MKKIKLLVTTLFFLLATSAQAEIQKILLNTDILDHLGLSYEENTYFGDLSIVSTTQEQRDKISEVAHDFHRCGGYEVLEDDEQNPATVQSLVSTLINDEIEHYTKPLNSEPIEFNQNIADSLELLEQENLKNTVIALSNYKTRSSRSRTPNEHVNFMKGTIDDIIANSKLEITSELVEHRRSKQNSIKVTIRGSESPDELVIIGAHLDSTAFRGHAPGADDNASGSANVLEIFRVLSLGEQPLRTIELFWYGAEEVGLVGSKDIAKNYAAEKRNVIAVMNLDMTGFAGTETFTLSNITDYTTPWVRDLIVGLNQLYINAIILESKCGYGCSDHASWYRSGFPTVFPIESKFRDSNKSIHSPRDTVEKLNFDHSLVFSKLGLSFLMQLAS